MKEMLGQFQKNLNRLKIETKSNIFVAVSGGIDSMVLAVLCIKSNLKISILHCNFQLRGEASLQDEIFVENFAKENNIPFFSKRFDVEKYKSKGNYSTQMAARNLRYDWFSEFNYDYLFTAHQLDDSLETFFINLSRGTGISGLTGIPIVQNKIIRPLFNISRKQIINYAKANKIQWKEDETNLEDNYLRNKIRHKIIPQLRDLNQNFDENFLKTIQFLKDEEEINKKAVNQLKQSIFKEKNQEIRIKTSEIQKSSKTEIYHLFKDYKFNFPDEIIKLSNSANGSEINSENWRLIKNREELILTKTRQETAKEISINDDETILNPVYLRLSKSNEKDKFAAETVDFDKLNFPLILRKPKAEDVFFPLNMKGSKTVKKFLKDEKLSKTEKENIWILCDAENQIIWILGLRLDDRFKINEQTNKYLNFYLC